jgi:hypothetical protein
MKLEVVLSGAVTTNQLQVNVVYMDQNAQGEETKRKTLQSVTVNTTDVTVCPAPTSGLTRNIENISVYNADTVNATVAIKIDNGGTETIIVKHQLTTTQSLVYESMIGWFII